MPQYHYAQITSDGICIAVSSLSAPVTADHMIALTEADSPVVGRRWDGLEWVEVPHEEVPDVPPVVSRFQARAALHLAGLLTQVEALMQAPETDMLAKLAWADAQEFRRTSPTVLAMSAALGLTDEQLDALFIAAAGIEA